MQGPGFAARSALIDWSVSWRALPGERESGDLHVVAPFATGVLVAVVDGLGHGPEAAAAARIAATVLQDHAQEPIIGLMERCHKALRKTRGAVLTIASINSADGLMRWMAVGNVVGYLFHADRSVRPSHETVNPRSGVVGYQLPPLRASELPIRPGDMLAFATDGIRDGFAAEMPLDRSPQETASQILRRFGKDTDDSLVLVARWLGAPP